MVTVEVQVAASYDDAVRSLKPWYSRTYRNQFGSESEPYTRYGIGLRFQGVDIPKDTIPDVAYLIFRCNSDGVGANTYARISCEDVDSAPEFPALGSDFDTRYANHTTAEVDWDSIESWFWGNIYHSPSIISPLAEVFARAGWVANNDLVVFVHDFDDRSTHGGTEHRRSYSYDDSPDDAVILHIEYTLPPPPPPPPAGNSPGTVIRSIATPTHNPMGLTFDGRTLWSSSGAERLIYQIDPETGTVIRSFTIATGGMRGLAFDGRCLWLVDNATKIISQIDPETGTVIRSFAAPVLDPWGLTFDGRWLWAADYVTDRIYQIDPETGTVIRSFAAPAAEPAGLAFDGRTLWCAEPTTPAIHQIDPETGTVIQSFATPAAAPTGLTFDGRCLWAADWTAKRIYQIQVA